MLRGSLLRQRSLAGFLEKGLLDSRQLRDRHDALVEEMLRRGYHHHSPLRDDFDPDQAPGDIDVTKSRAELYERCDDCRTRGSALA